MNFVKIHSWWRLAPALALGFVLMLPLLLACQGLRWLLQRSLVSLKWRLLTLWLILSSALLLCGCGTRPLQVQTSPPVPAALMQPPAKPVLLPPASPWVTPGTTTKPMPGLAPKTGFGIKP